MSISKVTVVNLSIGIILLFSGCSTISAPFSAKGEQFAGFKKPEENRGMVYIYRPNKFAGGAVSYDIHVGTSKTPDFLAGTLLNGGYIEIDLPIGETEIWAKVDDNSIIAFDIKNGKTYCIKSALIMADITTRSPDLEIVNMSQCKSEILETKLVQ